MGFRALQVGIVGFWVVMTVLLVRSVVSDAARYKEVPLSEFAVRVLPLAERISSPPTLYIFSEGVEVGDARVFVQHATRDEQEGGAAVSIKIDGTLDTEHLSGKGAVSVGTASMPSIRFILRSLLDEGGAPESIGLDFSVAGQSTRVSLSYEPGGAGITYKITDGTQVLYSNTGQGTDLLTDVGNLPLSTMGIPFTGMPGALAGGPPLQAAGATPSIFTAKHGTTEIAGIPFGSYILEAANPLGDPFRLIFAESGELMAIDNIPGYEVVAESFVPLEMVGEKRRFKR